jgi:hypothetical protein
MSNRNMRTVDVDELQSELQRTKEQVEAWSRETVAYSSALKDQHSKRMQNLRGNCQFQRYPFTTWRTADDVVPTGEVTSMEAELRKLQSTSQHVQERKQISALINPCFISRCMMNRPGPTYDKVRCHAVLYLLAVGLHREQGELLAVEDLSQSLRAERDSMQRKVQAISETVHIEKVEFQKREAGECALLSIFTCSL